MTTDRMPPAASGELGRLELGLAALGDALAYPPTPDLASAVRLSLRNEPTIGWQRSLSALFGGRQYRVSLALAVVGLLLAAGLAIAAAYSLGGLRIVFVNQLPPVPSHQAISGNLGLDLGIGEAMSLEAATAKVEYRVFVPTAETLGTPDAVYYSPGLAGGQISLAYGAGPGMPAPAAGGVTVLVTEFPGALQENLAQKSVGPGTTVETLDVDGGLGFWIVGSPHVLVYRDPNGQYIFESIRLVRNTLAWERDGTVLRIEGDLSREEALALAATFQPVATP